ncbi:hypothetical protein crov014 [Cafeteria roenbergensis virus]|uniref:Uncharacterized protein n=1 Tax=Cafeteria roenbergensis virus (strain BV-PW1) TaxID=693272 RepID=E3T4D4_CROVB|nr:hypothetical protein crov014 [Cafeteria roenbergensis virus BV-PW1]ADO67047.1 hypothetical protein crov014 [Cafeteria roenbergensis virus BV-PW1]
MKIIRKIGIILVLSVFMMSSFNKLTNFSNTVNEIEVKGIMFPFIALIIAIGLQLVGMSGVIINEFDLIDSKLLKNKTINKVVNKSQYLLVVFTLLATYYYHNILTMENQEINFMKNLSIIGGLLLI